MPPDRRGGGTGVGAHARPTGAGGRRARDAAALAAGTLAALATGCAKEEAPPGALPDQRPPGIREIVPAPGSVVPDFDDDLRIRLDEPVEFSGRYGRQMEASPAYDYRVTTGFSDIRVRPEGGWRPGAVYVLRLPGGFRDLLGNEREEPIEVVFSTGPEVTGTRISGRIRDRLTGEGVRGARLLLLAEEGDSIPYTAVADTGGIVSLPSVPPGRYTAYGFEDLNANRSLERRLEPHDSAAVHLEGATASAELSLRMTPPDSTPPALVRAEAADSLTVVLVFDDPLDPEQDLAAAEVVVRPSGGAALPVEEIGLTRPPAAEAPGAPPAGDSLPADPLPEAPDDSLAEGAADPRAGARADTTGAGEVPPGADTAGAGGPAGVQGQEVGPAAGPEGAPLPSDSLFLRLGRALEEGRTYRAAARDLRNLRGLVGGGDTTFVYAPPDTAAAGAEPPDSAAGRAP